MHLESDNEAEEREQCIELLKAMLEMNPDKRITPSEVLTHPFINCISNPWTREHEESSSTETSFDVLDFEMMGTLGEGAYGEIRKCRNNHTGEVVAVKRPKYKDGCDNEIAILKDLRHLSLGQSNIVRLCGWFNFSVGKAPVFEMLDKSLLDLIINFPPRVRTLSHIRVIIQQAVVQDLVQHLVRMPPGRLPGDVFRACPTGRRPRGRPRTRWRDDVSRLAWERLGIPLEELVEVAGDGEGCLGLSTEAAAPAVKRRKTNEHGRDNLTFLNSSHISL